MKRHPLTLAGSLRRSQRGVFGFTLIELLVVIAVTSILIGMLIPLAQKVRTAQIELAMPQNLAKIDLAIHNYEEDNTALPINWFVLDPYLDDSFASSGDELLKDGYSFTLVGVEATDDPALAETSLTKVVKAGSATKKGGKLQVLAEPKSPMVGTKKYVLDHSDGSIKSTTDPKLVDEQEKRILEIKEEGTKQIVKAAAEYVGGTPEDDSAVDLLAGLPDTLKQGAMEFVAGDDGKVSLDDIKKLAGNEAEPPKDGLQEFARFAKHKLDIGIGNEKTDGSNGAEVDIEGLTLPAKDTLTWDVFRDMVRSFLEDPGVREALLALADAAETSEKNNPEATSAKFDALRQVIDAAVLGDFLSLKEGVELRYFLDTRWELLGLES